MNRYSSRIADIGSLASGPMKVVLDHWNAVRGASAMPSGEAVLAGGRLPATPHCVQIDVPERLGDMSFRMFGSGLTLAVGRDYTHYRILDLEPSDYADLVFRDYSEVAHCAVPVLREVRAESDGDTRCYQRLVLPLGQREDRVDGLLAVSAINRRFWGAVLEDRAAIPPVMTEMVGGAEPAVPAAPAA
ncbi:MAG: hypothetical protein R8L07_02770 [Alphaproteobacteria bacterium]|nr:hypothetical protein [Alphaproteobacteria bacterium]